MTIETKKKTKRQLARQQALEVLAEQRQRQKQLTAVVSAAFLARADLDDARYRLAAAAQKLNELEQPHAWIRETFHLTATQLKDFLTLTLPPEFASDQPTNPSKHDADSAGGIDSKEDSDSHTDDSEHTSDDNTDDSRDPVDGSADDFVGDNNQPDTDHDHHEHDHDHHHEDNN